MNSNNSAREVIPSASRLIKSLRDMGYDFSAAIADLVDNSIEARATKVAIDVEFAGGDSQVRITDNGRGMTSGKLIEAMRYGSKRKYRQDDLGRFGLGLKTASLSQCQRLSVATRTDRLNPTISAFCWDLRHVERTDKWEVLSLKPSKQTRSIFDPLKGSTGTVVLWQRLDRILDYKVPDGDASRKRLLTMCRELEQHLAMVFHRFLSGEVLRRKFELTLNGNPVQAWDPFARSEPGTVRLHSVTIPVEYGGAFFDVKLEPFILPHQDAFSSPEAFRLASGPANWNQQQGFYIYRGNRLIQSGGWSRLRTSDEHSKLARIALSFPPSLDGAFRINVAKMRVQLPPQIKEQIEEAIKPALKLAQETYRKGIKAPKPTSATQRWSLEELQVQLENIAEPAEKLLIRELFTRLRNERQITGD